MPLAAVETPRLYRQIADQLRGLIDAGEFAVGCRLPPERELAEKLGVSRPSVREALIALEVEGRVRIRMGSGVYVLASDETRASDQHAAPADGPFEVLEARELLESALCARAAITMGPAEIAALDAILARMETAGLTPDALIALDRSFHIAIANVLGNGTLVRLVGELFDERINPYFSRLAGHFETKDSWSTAAAEHRAVRDALAAGDAAGASAAMTAHLAASSERFSQSFGGQGRSSGRGQPAPRSAPTRAGASGNAFTRQGETG